MSGLMQRREEERYQHGVWPRCACRGDESGSAATLACRCCRLLVLPAL